MLGDDALELEIAIGARGCFLWPMSGAVDLVFGASDLTGILACFY
jgi:hypothetical protein